MKRAFIIFMAVLMCFTVSCGGSEAEKKENKTESKDEITIYSLKDSTLCPIIADNDANRQMLAIIYESLVRIKDNMEAEGVLAENWKVDEGNIKWTFELRSGVKWHDGSSLEASDVVYTVNQIKANPSSSYYISVSKIASAEAEGNRVVFGLNEPCANFANLMTFPIIKRESMSTGAENFSPCGTGAYIFADDSAGNVYYLKRNENWWGGKAKTKTIKVKLLPDKETVMYSFSSGTVDIANADADQQGKFMNNSWVKSVSCPTTVYNFIGINHNKPILAVNAVRKVIDKGINRKKIITDIYAENAAMARCPIRENWFLNGDFADDFRFDAEDVQKIAVPLEWEKKDGIYYIKIEDREYKAEFELIVNEDNANRRNIAENVKLDLANAGIAVNIVSLPYEEYESRIKEGNYDLFVGSVMIPDDISLDFLLGGGNMFSYVSDEMTELLSIAKSATGKENITEAYGNIRKKFNEDIPVVGLYFENFNMFFSPEIAGGLMSSPNNIYDGIYNLSVKG